LAPEKEFSSYIKLNKQVYEEGQDLLDISLMNMANNKYKGLMHTSKEQKEISALTAKLEFLTKKKMSDKNEELVPSKN